MITQVILKVISDTHEWLQFCCTPRQWYSQSVFEIYLYPWRRCHGRRRVLPMINFWRSALRYVRDIVGKRFVCYLQRRRRSIQNRHVVNIHLTYVVYKPLSKCTPMLFGRNLLRVEGSLVLGSAHKFPERWWMSCIGDTASSKGFLKIPEVKVADGETYWL